MTDQGIQAGDIPPGEQIHPGPGVKNAAPRYCSAADEWSYLSCHEGSAGEVTAQLYLVSGADACTPLSFTREETEKKEEREGERNQSCPIKHFFSPSRAHLTSHHPAVLLPREQALTHLYVFPSDLSTSFLSAPVNHKLMYEGNF